MFEIRKNKWLSNGQSGYNFLLSVQVFGCPYLEYYKHVQRWVLVTDLWMPSDNCISIFWLSSNFLVVPGAQTTKISNADNNIIIREYEPILKPNKIICEAWMRWSWQNRVDKKYSFSDVSKKKYHQEIIILR